MGSNRERRDHVTGRWFRYGLCMKSISRPCEQATSNLFRQPCTAGTEYAKDSNLWRRHVPPENPSKTTYSKNKCWIDTELWRRLQMQTNRMSSHLGGSAFQSCTLSSFLFRASSMSFSPNLSFSSSTLPKISAEFFGLDSISIHLQHLLSASSSHIKLRQKIRIVRLVESEAAYGRVTVETAWEWHETMA